MNEGEMPVAIVPLSAEQKKEGDFTLAVNKGVDNAKRLLLRRFGMPNPNHPEQFYHVVDHSKEVATRAEKIVKALGGTSRDEQLVSLAAYWHDSVQNSKTPRTEEIEYNGKKYTTQILARDRGMNEKKSADELEEYMRSQSVFTEEDIATVREAINATFPDFKDGTAIQPNLTAQSSLVTKALCLADLGTAGMIGGDAFMVEGNNLFREEQLDIPELLREAMTASSQRKEEIEGFVAHRIKMYYSKQLAFVQAREDYFKNTELSFFTPQQQEGLNGLFTKFEETKNKVREYQADLEKQSARTIIDTIYKTKEQSAKFNEKKPPKYTSIAHLQ